MKIILNIQSNTNLIIPFRAKVSTWVGLLLFCVLLSSCSGLSRLQKNEKLYTGAEIKLEKSENIDKGKIKSIATEALRPVPNKSYLGMRPKLWLYMTAGENPKSKFAKWMKKRAVAPVLLSQVKPLATAAIIDAKLFNIGIFNSTTTYQIIEKKHTASIIYTTTVHKPYTITNLTYAISDDSLSSIILSKKNKSFIKIGDNYNLDVLKNERIRIDALLKNKGYFYFNPDYLLFKADTTVENKGISFKITLKDSIPDNATTVYRINKVIINQDYSLLEKTDNSLKSFSYEDYEFSGDENDMNINPKVILRSVYLKKNEIYSREKHAITLNRLMSMGNFKFVQLKFADSDSTATGFLDVNILMTPLPNYNFKAELDLVTKSNDYSGPRVNLSLLDRNTFKGAEFLNLSMAGSFEAQLGRNNDLYSYSLNPQLELTLPHFLLPFDIKTNSLYIPKTRFLLSYNYLKRVNYFDMNTLQFIFGYKWRNDIRREQEFDPLNISYNTIRNQSSSFTALLDSNPFLKKSYEEQFISGASYSFTYNDQMIPGKKLQAYLQFRAEVAGNLFSLIKNIGGEKISSENPAKIIGSVYSQFAKMSFDGRSYLNLSDKSKIALRIFTGAARSYGNSSTLPYSKQFFSGGPNSLRAFSINSVGPGTYLQNTDINSFLQLGGDIKVEMNAEYRFDIYKYFKGALFVDAGNVWLQNSNSTGIGTPFAFSSFMNELAVGAGMGLRVDVSYFVLRFDLAMPLRKPWLQDNQRWVLNKINFAKSEWRSNNLVLNIAIGYPF